MNPGILAIERIDLDPVVVIVGRLLAERLTVGDDLELWRGSDKIADARVMGILPNVTEGPKAFDDARRGDRIKVVVRTSPRDVPLDPQVVVRRSPT